MPAVVERTFAPGAAVRPRRPRRGEHHRAQPARQRLQVRARCSAALEHRPPRQAGRSSSVRDEGPGIPAADLPHVFERFYRGEKTRAREEGGSGLGLSIVQGLARAQGGDVAIRSIEGGGTTVTVWFPLAPGPAAAPYRLNGD